MAGLLMGEMCWARPANQQTFASGYPPLAVAHKAKVDVWRDDESCKCRLLKMLRRTLNIRPTLPDDGGFTRGDAKKQAGPMARTDLRGASFGSRRRQIRLRLRPVRACGTIGRGNGWAVR